MSGRQLTAKRSVNGLSSRKVVPVITNIPVHSSEADNRKATPSHSFKEDKYAAGIRASNNHDYSDAVKQFSLIKPDTTTSLYLSGCARLELKYYVQTQEAIQDFTKCIALAAKNEHAEYAKEVWYKRAQAYHTIRRYNEAIRDYTEFIDRCRTAGVEAVPELHRSLIARGQTYQAMYELDMAMQDMNEANKLTKKNDPYYLCCQAGVHVSRGENEKALEDIARATDIGCNNDPEALVQRGIVYAELGRDNAALEDFSKAMKLSGKPAEQSDISVRGGLSLYALNNKREAFQWFERAVTLNPLNARAHYRVGVMQREKGQYNEALKSLNRAYELGPDEGDILLERATVHQHLGNREEAAADKKRGEQLNSSTSAVTTMLDDRIKKLREEKDRTGVSARNHLELAMAYDGLINQKKDFKKRLEYYKTAVMEYRAAIKADTKYLYPQAYALLALCQKKMNDLNEAHELHLEFYNLLDREKEALYHWKTYLLDVKNKMEAGKLEPHLDENAVSKLVHMELNRRKKDVDVETFQSDTEDKFKNQLDFYEQMRLDLSNLLAAITIFNLDTPTIIDNVEGTINRVGKIVQLISTGEKSLSTIESTLNSTERVSGKLLRKTQLDTTKMKLRSLGNVGDMIDQLDIAQLVARHLCTRYHSQLICLRPNNRQVNEEEEQVIQAKPAAWWKCCGGGGGGGSGGNKWLFSKPTINTNENDVVVKLATFAIAFIIQAINNETIRVSTGGKSARKDALGTALVLVVCQAHLTSDAKKFPSLLPTNRTLPISLTAVSKMLKLSKVPNVDQTISSIEWNLDTFFHAPGIYYYSDTDTGKLRYYGSGPSMIPEKYGYRLGTKEEVDVLRKPRWEDTE